MLCLPPFLVSTAPPFRRYSKEQINDALLAGGADPFVAGLAAGAGGGVCQVAVMGPCTFLVTGAVTAEGGKQMSTMQRARVTWCGVARGGRGRGDFPC